MIQIKIPSFRAKSVHFSVNLPQDSAKLGCLYLKFAILEKNCKEELASARPEWQEGAGSLLLLAATQQTDLLPSLERALSPNLRTADPSLRLAHSQPTTLRSQ